MSAPKFDVYNIDLNTMQVKHVGRIEATEALHHPSGWVFVRQSDGVWLHTPDSMGWRKVEGRSDEITITK